MSKQSWPTPGAITYGGDYNPEQWPRAVWHEDVRLMREAEVNLVSVGIFSWALLETDEGKYDFSWLDEALDLLHANGIAVDLGTPTASPPAWFFARYPNARAVDANGVVAGFGSRGMASHSSPEYRAAAKQIATKLAERYGSHPAVVMWHVHNEYGVPVGEDFSQAAVTSWRSWLQQKYQSLAALNAAWGTAFWGQNYIDWEHIPAPAHTPSVVNPAMKLDWARFTDDQLRECFRIERDAIRAHASQPITTNFMAHQSWNTDLWKWAREVDIVSDDQYLWSPDPRSHVGLALSADLTRSVARGKPWMLMEHSTSAVNWQGRNIAKQPGEMHRNALTHLGRGADAIMFFQWRASRSGAEKFHSAMLPHHGAESRVFREVTALGKKLSHLSEVQGSRVHAEVAVLYDWESLWAQDLEWRPSDDLDFRERIRTHYERLWNDGIQVDFAHPQDDLSSYRLVLAPSSYLLTRAAAENLTSYVSEGGTLLVSCFAAAVDEFDAVHTGGFGAPLANVLGLEIEEYLPLRSESSSAIDFGGCTLHAASWSEDIIPTTAHVLATYRDGPARGGAAITRNTHGKGVAWYLSADLGVDSLAPVVREVYEDAGITRSVQAESVEVMHRHGREVDWLVAVNHGDGAAHLNLQGYELLHGKEVKGEFALPAGETAVIRTTKNTTTQTEN